MKNNSERFQLFWKSQFSINKQTIDGVLFKIDKEINYLTTSALPRASKRQVRKILKEIETLESQKAHLCKKRDEWTKTYDELRNPRAAREIKQVPHDSDMTEDSEKTYGLQNQRIDLSQVKKDWNDVQIYLEGKDWIVECEEHNIYEVFSTKDGAQEWAYKHSQEEHELKDKSQVKKADKNKDQVVNEALILLLGAKRSYGVSIVRGNAISALRAVDKDRLYEDEWDKMADWIVNEFKNANKSQIHKEMFFDKKQVLKDLYCKVFGSSTGLSIDELDENEIDEKIKSLQDIFDRQ